jgi:hypothetical protein
VACARAMRGAMRGALGTAVAARRCRAAAVASQAQQRLRYLVISFNLKVTRIPISCVPRPAWICGSLPDRADQGVYSCLQLQRAHLRKCCGKPEATRLC